MRREGKGRKGRGTEGREGERRERRGGEGTGREGTPKYFIAPPVPVFLKYAWIADERAGVQVKL